MQGFKGSALFGIVSVAAFTGASRNEILALRWTDLEPSNKTLRIERALEETKSMAFASRGPRKKATSAQSRSTMICWRCFWQNARSICASIAGIPDSAAVDLSLVKLPEEALMFPNPPGPDGAYDRPCATCHQGICSEGPQSSGSNCGFTTCGARMKRYCLTVVCPYMWSRPAAAMTQRCCCAATPSERARQIPARQVLSATYRRAYLARPENVWVQIGSKP